MRSRREGAEPLTKMRAAALYMILTGVMTMASCGGNNVNRPDPVASVDLHRYRGKWYEIAKIPNRFQRKCAGNTTAEYTLRADGTVLVVNSCLDHEGKRVIAEGIGKVTDPLTNARLKVSFVKLFGVNFFWGDYWILGLDKDYHYAVVGVPNRKYGWILSRRPELSSAEWTAVEAILRSQGYHPEDFERTRHSSPNE